VGIYIYGKDILEEWKQLSFAGIVEHKILIVIFWTVWAVLSVFSFKYKFSVLPVIGILVNLYLMTQLGKSNWMIFIIWLTIGLVIYFLYGRKNSKLNVGSSKK
jgi:uncharacterized membrane protein